MKSSWCILWIVSHGVMAGVGRWLASDFSEKPQVSQAEISEGKIHQEQKAEMVNPIFKASGADFRAAWEAVQNQAEGKKWGNLDAFFIDWCGVDPEGAILALKDHHPSHQVNHFLSNAVNYYGATMAPALVTHWEKLKHLEDYKLQGILTESLRAMAYQDPDQAESLIFQLPSILRRNIYGNIMTRMDADSRRDFAEVLLLRAPQIKDKQERRRLWQSLADTTALVDQQAGLLAWLPRLTSEDGFKIFAKQVARNAVREQTQAQLISIAEILPENQKMWLLEQLDQAKK